MKGPPDGHSSLETALWIPTGTIFPIVSFRLLMGFEVPFIATESERLAKVRWSRGDYGRTQIADGCFDCRDSET